MTKKEKEKFAQTSITLAMVEIAQDYVPDLFGKFSKTKTGSVLKKLRKEISVNSYVWNSYMSPSETSIPVLMPVFNTVVKLHPFVVRIINGPSILCENLQIHASRMERHGANEAEIATLKDEVARVTAERDGEIRSCEEARKSHKMSHQRAMEPDGPPPPLELVMCMPDR